MVVQIRRGASSVVVYFCERVQCLDKMSTTRVARRDLLLST